jgi:hypothetical protein
LEIVAPDVSESASSLSSWQTTEGFALRSNILARAIQALLKNKTSQILWFGAAYLNGR